MAGNQTGGQNIAVNCKKILKYVLTSLEKYAIIKKPCMKQGNLIMHFLGICLKPEYLLA